jgi:hypothetical protein
VEAKSQGKTRAGRFAATAIRHRWLVWHAALRALCTAMGAIPRSSRFPAAVLLARLLVPVVRMTEMFRVRRTAVVETPVEIVLYAILNALTRAGTEFDPQVQISGSELIESSVRSGKGVLLIGTRTMLGHAFLRCLSDRGYSISLVSPVPCLLFGSKAFVPTISPGLKYFFEVREHLRRAEIVVATPDRGRARRARTMSVKTREGTVHFATPLIEVAINAKADVIFMRTWLKDDVINVELSPSSWSDDPGAHDIAFRYAELVRRHVAARAASAADRP